MRPFAHAAVVTVACAVVNCAPAPTSTSTSTAEVEAEVSQLRSEAPLIRASGERIWAAGAFSCDFTIDFTQAIEPIGAEIERDRIFMQRYSRAYSFPRNPGMLQKHIPLLPLDETHAHAGGRYLFQGRLQAAVYEEFVTQRFEYPVGTQFLSRPAFSNPECRDWTVLTAWRFAPLDTHTVLRTERFDTGRTTLGQELALAAALLQQAPALVAAAQAQGYAEVQLLHNLMDHKVQVVYFHRRVGADNPDGAALGLISSSPALADAVAAATGLTKVFDIPTFVLTVWLPYAEGDSGDAALWPNTPPIPGPACGDGVCTPSRGEVTSCPADCLASCGNATCDVGETLHTCPSDCELPLAY